MSPISILIGTLFCSPSLVQGLELHSSSSPQSNFSSNGVSSLGIPGGGLGVLGVTDSNDGTSSLS